MKVRICFLVMALAPLLYYGAVQMAPAGRAATVSSGFHELGKVALAKIESSQEALTETDEVFNQRITDADRSMSVAAKAAHTAADQRDYTRLVSYLRAVKEDRMMMLAQPDPNQHSESEQTNSARQGAEQAFQQ